MNQTPSPIPKKRDAIESLSEVVRHNPDATIFGGNPRAAAMMRFWRSLGKLDSVWETVSGAFYRVVRRSRLACETTVIELKAIAASAIIGCRSPKNAIGIATTL